MRRRRFGQQTRFFAATALVCFAVSWPAPVDYRWVAWTAAALAAFWCVMFALEDLTRGARRGAAEPPVAVEMPFPPPPFPRG